MQRDILLITEMIDVVQAFLAKWPPEFHGH
jgi:hypothetical protein